MPGAHGNVNATAVFGCKHRQNGKLSEKPAPTVMTFLVTCALPDCRS
ncbi:MAG: hypothetical protein IPK82_36140 [Polyangiaceae bacterium]|nr:hypothetical protein [Polyangiaceae bacterium]